MSTSGHRCSPLASRGLLLALLAVSVGCGRADPETTTGSAVQPAVEARASVDPAVATTGDVITYAVTVEHDLEIDVTLPELGSQIAGFRIVDLGQDEPMQVGQRIVERLWYKLRADVVGSYVLPPVTVHYRTASPEGAGEGSDAQIGPVKISPVQTITTSEIFVEVQSVLPADGEAADILDIKPLQALPQGRPWGWIAAVGALVLLLLAAGGYLLWRRRQPAMAKPALPAHVLAFRQLDALRATDFTDPVAVRRFHFDICEVLRGYVEGRFGLNATDLTRQEIVPHLATLPGLDSEPAAQLDRFLATTDRVKFAAFEPSEAEIEVTYELALGFVEATAPSDPVPTEESGSPKTTEAPPSQPTLTESASEEAA